MRISELDAFLGFCHKELAKKKPQVNANLAVVSEEEKAMHFAGFANFRSDHEQLCFIQNPDQQRTRIGSAGL